MNLLDKPHRNVTACVALGVITLIAFCPVLTNNFVLDEDPVYITENPLMKSDLGLKSFTWSLMMWRAGHWHPVTWLSHLLDYTIFGPEPAGHHLVSLLLHAANVILLFYLLQRMTGHFWASAAVACLFAVHPLRVESVAWAAQRKDVLSTLFMLLAILAYLRYVERPALSRYLVILLFFGLGLLSKSSVMMLPALLLLLDFWPLNRFPFHLPWRAEPEAPPVEETESAAGAPASAPMMSEGAADTEEEPELGEPSETPEPADAESEAQAPEAGPEAAQAPEGAPETEAPPADEGPAEPRDLKSAIGLLLEEKYVLFAMSAMTCFLALAARGLAGFVGNHEAYPFAVRLGNAALACLTTIWHTVWPVGLSVFYPHPGAFISVGKVICAAVVLLAVTVWVVRSARPRPYLAFGWLWFLVALLPVLGLIQFGAQATADHFTYVPCIGLFIIAAWGLPRLLAEQEDADKLLAAAAGVVLVALALITVRQVTVWNDTETLFRHALSVTEDNYVAHYFLGLAKEEQAGKNETTAPQREKDAGQKEQNAGQKEQDAERKGAAGNSEEAARLKQEATDLRESATRLKQEATDLRESAARLRGEVPKSYQEALALKPDYADALTRLAMIELREADLKAALGQTETAGKHRKEAERLYRRAVESNPYHVRANHDLALMLARRGELHQSYRYFWEALRVDPDFEEGHISLAKALTSGNRVDDAIRHYQKALRANPDSVEAHVNSAILLAKKGKLAEAEQHCREAIRVDSGHADANNNLGVLLKHRGQAEEAIASFRRASEARPENIGIHFNLAVACHELGQYDEAVRHYSDILRLNTKHAVAQIQLSAAMKKQPPVKLQQQKKEEPKPEKSPEKPALPPDQQKAVAYYNRAQALFAENKLQDAIKHYQEAVRLSPKFASAINNLGAAFYKLSTSPEIKPEDRQKLIQAAANHFQAAIQADPGHAEAHNNWATILMAVKRYDEAIRHYSEALRIKSDYQEAKAGLQKAMRLKAQPEAVPAPEPKAPEQPKEQPKE